MEIILKLQRSCLSCNVSASDDDSCCIFVKIISVMRFMQNVSTAPLLFSSTHFKLTRAVTGAPAQQRYFTKTQVDLDVWLHFSPFSYFSSFLHSSSRSLSLISFAVPSASVFFYLYCHLQYKHDATNI